MTERAVCPWVWWGHEVRGERGGKGRGREERGVCTGRGERKERGKGEGRGESGGGRGGKMRVVEIKEEMEKV